jgi:ribosomal protein L11 methylase PrmA
MNRIINEPLRTYDIHVKPELQELAIGVLLTNGLNSFEEIETQEGLVGFRIWTSPTLSQSDIKSWFTPLLVDVTAHRTTGVTMALDLSNYSHRFRLVNQPEALEEQTSICLLTGSGFGWGEHATTQLGLEFFWTQYPEKLMGQRVLDFGAGTGILSFAAQCCGALEIDAVEIDSASLHTLKNNVAVNQRAARFTCMQRLHNDERTYDLIVANIYLNVLQHELPNLIELLSPKGRLWVSGYPGDASTLIANIAAEHDMMLEGSAQMGDWHSATFVRCQNHS